MLKCEIQKGWMGCRDRVSVIIIVVLLRENSAEFKFYKIN